MVAYAGSWGGDQTALSTRLRAAVPALAVHVLLALVLLNGLTAKPEAEDSKALKILPTVEQVEPPPPEVMTVVEPAPGAPEPKVRAEPLPEEAPAPPNLEANPAPVVAPPPPLPLPTPVAAAPTAGTGAASSAGAAPTPGPGTGAGGSGTGRGGGGGGGGGNGGGGGGGGEGIVARPPRWVCCNLSLRDVPRAIQENTRPGMSVVSVIYTVEADGRVTGCRVSRSSGNRALDQTTCRLVEQRYRFQPARNPYGRPIRAVGVGDDHEWMFRDEDEDDPRRRDRNWD
jgi:protein TonB